MEMTPEQMQAMQSLLTGMGGAPQGAAAMPSMMGMPGMPPQGPPPPQEPPTKPGFKAFTFDLEAAEDGAITEALTAWLEEMTAAGGVSFRPSIDVVGTKLVICIFYSVVIGALPVEAGEGG